MRNVPTPCNIGWTIEKFDSRGRLKKTVASSLFFIEVTAITSSLIGLSCFIVILLFCKLSQQVSILGGIIFWV